MDIENLQLLCSACNGFKGVHDFDTFVDTSQWHNKDYRREIQAVYKWQYDQWDREKAERDYYLGRSDAKPAWL